MKMEKRRIKELAGYTLDALHYEDGLITPELVTAIAIVESGGETQAVRYEPKYKWLVNPAKVKPANCTKETEIVLQKTSWGLLQVMGAVAREYGFQGWLTELLNPARNLYYGIVHLITLEERGQTALGDKYNLDALISDYNDGTWRRMNNLEYVEKVKKEMGHGYK